MSDDPRLPQGLDGRSHLTFYDRASALSFVWGGRYGTLVDVDSGGYGEPTTDSFNLTFDPYTVPLYDALALFKGECLNYIQWARKFGRLPA